MSPRDVVAAIIQIINLLVFVRILMSWLPMAGIRLDPYSNPLVRVIFQLTDPILEPFRRLIPAMGGIDFSPIVAILVLNVLGDLVISLMPG